MKALLLKDAYLIWKYCKSLVLICLIFSIVSLWTPGITLRYNGFFLLYPCILMINIPTSLLSLDSSSKWDLYAAALPYSQAQLVSAKYLLGLFLGGGILVLTLVSQGLRMYAQESFRWDTLIGLGAGLLCLYCLPLSLCLPLLYFFGAEKGRMLYVFLLISLSGVLGGVIYFMPELAQYNLSRLTLPALPPVLGLLVLSWWTSIRICRKREL